MFVLSHKPVLSALFFIPYTSIGATGAWMLLVAWMQQQIVCGIFGAAMIALLLLHLLGLLGNHYLKVYTFLVMMAYFVVFMFFFLASGLAKGLTTASDTEESLGLLEVLVLFWMPHFLYMFVLVRIPSVSEILPGQLYLGNASFAADSARLQAFGATHMIELSEPSETDHGEANSSINHSSGDRESTNDVQLLHLECSDMLGSEKGLMEVAPRALQFLNKALDERTDEKKKDEDEMLGRRVLVHCSAGVSQSPALVVLWLVHSQRVQSADEALHLVQMARPCVDIGTDHWKAIQDYLRDNTLPQNNSKYKKGATHKKDD